MLTSEEKRFIEYWEKIRNQKIRKNWNPSAGGPFVFIISITILISVFSGWYKRASMVLRVSPGAVFMIIFGIIIFSIGMIILSSRHRWEMNEQRYRELMNRWESQAKKD